MPWRICVLTSLLCASLAGAVPDQDEDESPDPEAEPPDALLFRQADLKSDAKSLLAFFRSWCPPPAQRDRLPHLVRRLADEDASARQDAEAELRKIGPAAAGALRA